MRQWPPSAAYAMGENEKLIGEAIAGRRDEVVLATKFGVIVDPDTGRPAIAEARAEDSRSRSAVRSSAGR